MFVRRKYVYLNYDDMQKLLERCRKNRMFAFSDIEVPLRNFAYINDKLTKLEVTVKFEEACTYIFDKTGDDRLQTISGLDAYIQLSRAFYNKMKYKLPDYPADFTSKAILRYDNAHNGKRVQAYAYDQNSSYGWAMCQPMPDTREVIGTNREVKDGEIGFITHHHALPRGWTERDGEYLIMVDKGQRATWIFKEMESPFKDFAERWYDRKCNSKGDERQKAKEMLVFSVGYLQHHNPFLRASVIEYANRYILSLIDKNTIYANTDCIVSLQPREDLPIGTGLGQFKLEHQGLFAHNGFNTQWDYDIPSYRGVPKAWFKQGYDILKDPPPPNRNRYEFNRITFRLEKYYEEI